MKLTLPLAAGTGAETDYLLLGLVGVSIAVLALVFGLMALLHHPLPPQQSDRPRGPGRKDVPFRNLLDHRHSGRVLRPVHLGVGDLRSPVPAPSRTP